MTILAIDNHSEAIKELADNLQVLYQWEDENCEEGYLWEWCEHRKRKASV